MAKTDITADRLRELLHYDPEPGIFTWLVDAAMCRKKGSPASSVGNSGGYSHISIKKVLFKAHRLAWLYVYGAFPDCGIDHINGVKNDNRISNLRPASYTTNGENQRVAHSNSKTGFLGVTKFRGCYVARIRINKVLRFIGRFKTPEAAHEAYLVEKRKSHSGCTI